MSWNSKWKRGIDYPTWGDNDVYKKTISGGYLINGESPKEAYQRVAKAVSKRLYKPELEQRFCLLYTSPSPRDGLLSRMPSSA